MTEWLPRLVARVPATVHTKLLAAFLAIVVLLIAVGAVGLQVLSGVDRRAADMVKLQRKIAAYRQLQHDATSQLYSVASTLLVPEERTLEATLRQLNQFGYDLDRLEFVAKDEAELLARVREDHDRFVQVVTHVVQLIRGGRVVEGREFQLAQATPLADRLERRMNELVNKAEADIVAGIEASHEAYITSRWVIIGFALGSIALALILGYAISWSLIRPVKQMDARLRQIASGDFSQRVEVSNRDELGALAANLNRMNEELGRLYHQIETASRHKSQFLANVSHELRTPLTAIKGAVDLLLREVAGSLNEKQKHYLTRVRSNAQHLAGLIDELLDLAKIEAGRLELRATRLSLERLVEEVAETLRPVAAEKDIALEISRDNLRIVVWADPEKLTQVLMNLIGNAIKFTPAQGKVMVAMARNGLQWAQVSVTDTGPGIAREETEKIFDTFYQITEAGKQKPKGTGLGLAISKALVELHGGKIWVESQVDRGSTLSFTLPIDRPRNIEALGS